MAALLLTAFAMPNSSKHAIILNTFGMVFALLCQEDIQRPWKCGTIWLEYWMGLLRTMFPGNRREFSVLDCLSSTTKVRYLSFLAEKHGWNLTSLKGKRGYLSLDPSQCPLPASGANDVANVYAFLNNVVAKYATPLKRLLGH